MLTKLKKNKYINKSCSIVLLLLYLKRETKDNIN